MIQNNLIRATNTAYIPKMLQYCGLTTELVGHTFKVTNFDSWNYLIDISQIFSFYSHCLPIDRTQTIRTPLKTWIGQAWSVPTTEYTLEQALFLRAKTLIEYNKTINVFWSGGLDSTTAITALLKQLTYYDQLKIVYTDTSVLEHPEYLKFIHKNYPQVECIAVNQSLKLDGIIVTGDGGDESHANIDTQFLNQHGVDVLAMPWEEFFRKFNANEKFINFCKNFFACAGRPITTVLEARWWYYLMCHVPSALNHGKLPLIALYHKNIQLDDVVSFIDCPEYNSYIYYNVDKIFPTKDYNNWRQFFKDYCFEFDKIEYWYRHKKKIGSGWMPQDVQKQVILDNQRWIALLEDGTKISTPSLPILSQAEFDFKYNNQLDYLINR